ncbi:hypothetical protein [Bacteriovorax sp. Seq25_V]|uniref:hypothetical protein n=1 Tax=Bacteriovorax sp. Seq25_V TaxID=1201288 RepID=UPI00038A529A|nr:hypothetical protein [Bacteriovorax sp. Seq25_V]EQC46577.1 hypothetical protein M900_2333 [Bacteriovorax sp. Seq25_V]
MKPIIVIFMFFMAINTYALVGDETCVEWSLINKVTRFPEHTPDKSFTNVWNCSTPSGTGHRRFYECNRIEKKCISWSPSPSEHQAEIIAKSISDRIISQLKETNLEAQNNYAKDTYSLIETYTNTMSEFLSNVLSTLKDKQKNEER